MSTLKHLTPKIKILMLGLLVLSILSTTLNLIINITGSYNNAVYLLFGCILPILCVVVFFFFIIDAYVDRKNDTHVYLLTALYAVAIIYFMVGMFVSR